MGSFILAPQIMKDAFIIGATLELQGNAEKSLTKIVANFERASKQSEFLQANLKKLGAVLDVLSPGFFKMADGLKASSDAMRSMNRTFTTFNARLEASAYRLDGAIERAAKLKASMAGLGEETAGANAAMATGGGGRRGGGGHGRIHAEPFKLGVFGFSAPTVAAAAVGYGLYETYKLGSEYARANAQFQAMNLGAQANQEADTFAMTHQFKGVSNIETMKLLRDATVIMKGNYKEGESIVPALAGIKYASNALGYTTTDEDLMKILRIAEMRGGFKNPQEMQDQLAFASQGIAAFGNTVTPRDMQNFIRTGGVAAMQQSDRTFWLRSLPLIQEMGGNRFGTALMSLYSALGTGKISTAAAMELDRLGMVKPNSLEFTTTGRIKRIKPGGIVNNEELNSNFVGFLFDTLFPAMAKKGIKTREQALQELAYILPNRTSANLAAQAYIQEEKIQQEYGMASNAMNYKQQQGVADKTPQGQAAQFSAVAQSLGVAISKLTLPPVIDGMRVLTTFLTELYNFFTTDHPMINKIANLFDGQTSIGHPPVNAGAMTTHTTVNIDGKQVAHAVTVHQGKQAARTMQSSANMPNPSASLMFQGFNGIY